ncbi:MAG: hypothetical protein NVS2B7_37300 [Herpetosiphon sp.]
MPAPDALNPHFVPPDFVIPTGLATPHFRLRPLTTADCAQDYAAVMESAALLNAMFGRDWPTATFTYADNLQDLAEHQQEYAQRQAFAYTVVNLDDTMCLGCVYINPPRGYPTDARVYLWVRQRAYDQGFDSILFHVVKTWLQDKWPFAHVLYPGRSADGIWFPLRGALA